MNYVITVEVLKKVADAYHAKFARYNISASRFETSNDNENWGSAAWPVENPLFDTYTDAWRINNLENKTIETETLPVYNYMRTIQDLLLAREHSYKIALNETDAELRSKAMARFSKLSNLFHKEVETFIDDIIK